MTFQEMQEFAKSFKSRKEFEDYVYQRIKSLNSKIPSIECLRTNLNEPTKKAYRIKTEKNTVIMNLTDEEFREKFIFSPPEMINKIDNKE